MDQLQQLLGQVFGQPKRAKPKQWHITWPDGRKGVIYKKGSCWWYDVKGGASGYSHISHAKADLLQLGCTLERK